MQKQEKEPVKDDFVDSEEQQLLYSFLSGDEYAYICIYKRYIDSLFSYGMGLGFEREMIKDAIQDVFYKLYFNRKLLNGVNKLKYYLFRMLKNRLLDIYDSTDYNDINCYESRFSIKVTVLDELIGEEDRLLLHHKIEKLLNCLTDRQREAVYLRFMQEMDYEEIAGLLNMTPAAVRKLIFRAIQRIRERNLTLFILIFSTSVIPS